MFERIVMSGLIGLFFAGSTAYADVTVMDNRELAATVVATQQQPLQPVLPEYNSSGQIGGVVAATNAPNVPITGATLGPAIEPPSLLSSGGNQMTLTLPVAIADQLANLPLRNISIQIGNGR